MDRTEVGYILDVARVGDGPARVVCIGGVAGAGKTTLAIHVAHRLRPHFPDGQLFATLRSATGEPVPVDTVVGRFLRALGVAAADVPTDAEEASALYRSLVADRDMLVVLDDVEREEQVRPLRPTGPGSLTLITGRRGLPGLPGARPVWLGAMPAAESRRLLRHVVGAERVDREPEATTALLEACGHLPLAVRAAGVRLATRPGWRIADLPTTPDALWEQLSTGDIDVRAALAAVRADPSDSGRGLPKRS